MNLQEWQANQNLAEYAHSLLTDPRFQGLLDMLRSSHVKNYQPAMGVEMQAQTHSLMLGQIQGYDLCLNNIEAADKFIPAQQPLQATFLEPELQEEK